MGMCKQCNITVHVIFFEGLIFHGRQVYKDFCGLRFVDHQVEYIDCLFM